jgi:hypothetical protein
MIPQLHFFSEPEWMELVGSRGFGSGSRLVSGPWETGKGERPGMANIFIELDLIEH